MFNQIIKGINCVCNINIGKVQLTFIITPYCSLCGCELKGNKMSTIPYGTFMASKMSANNAKLAKIEDENEREKLFKQYALQLNPMKYNSKMMNSIWGMYNRYSVHNLKKIMDDNSCFSTGNEQKLSVVSNVDKVNSYENSNKKMQQYRVKNNLLFSPENFY